MLRNYIKIAWRNLLRNKVFSFINITGLALGMATCLLISLYVYHELSYDRFHEKAARIVRVTFRANMNGNKINEAHVMPPTAQALLRDYPEVMEATRLRHAGELLLTKGNDVVRENAVAFADANFFEVFSFPLMNGSSKSALIRPNTVVISDKMARKYFGDANPIGKTLALKGSKQVLEITGVMADFPANSHFRYDFLIAMAGLDEAKITSWMQSEFFTYLVLPEGYDYKQLEAKLPQAVEKYMGPQVQQAFGMPFAKFREAGNDLGLKLQPLTDIHLHSDFAYDLSQSGDIRYVYGFGAIALFMLLIAAFNFMNLSTAGATKRAGEVGIRKVMGSVRSALVWQFLVESLLLTAIALLLAVGLVLLALPAFNNITGNSLTVNFLAIPVLLPGLGLFGLVVGVLAGSYPAFFLSSFKPIAVLKGGRAFQGTAFRGVGRITVGWQRVSLRSALVVIQFCLSFILIVGTVVVSQQLTFIRNAKLGYDKERVLVLHETGRLGKNETLFRQQLLQDSRVINASVSGYVPAGPSYNNNFLVYGDNKAGQYVKGIRYDVDEQYIPTLGMTMASGRNFSRAFSTDSSGIILNETAAKQLGWGNDAIGHTVTRPGNDGSKEAYRVIGVVQDFHFRSLHERITPLMMTMGNNNGTILLNVKTGDVADLLKTIGNQWRAFGVDVPFAYSFLTDDFNAVYRAEQQTGQVLGLFSGLTIFISCLGLFGLAIFTAESRTKEIGVRKVLGASIAGIVALLSKDFLKLVLIAILIASPIAWYAMNQWLKDFAYKIDIEWWMFVGAGLLAIGIALLTVSFQSVKAALMNPVKSLRSE
jgi:putative ABC transport system permease protein